MCKINKRRLQRPADELKDVISTAAYFVHVYACIDAYHEALMVTRIQVLHTTCAAWSYYFKQPANHCSMNLHVTNHCFCFWKVVVVYP